MSKAKAKEAPPKAVQKMDLSDRRFASLSREMTFEREAIDDKARTVKLAFASEEPVERWFGMEELGCTKDECDLSRMNDGAPLLRNHDPDQQIGVIESATVDADKVGRCIVRFADDEEGEKQFRRVKSGIVRKASVGYRVLELVLTKQSDDGPDTYRAKRWVPHEVSLVSVPADNSVGVGRSLDTTEQPQPTTGQMKSAEIEPTPAPAAPAPVVAVTREAAPAAMPESHRMSEIRAIGQTFNVPQERVIKALAENETLDTFRAWVLESHLKAKPVTVPPTIGMNREEKRRYSFQRAIKRIADRQPLDGLEREASDAAEKIYRRTAPGNGFIIPHDVADFSDREMMLAMFRVNPSLGRTMWGQAMQRDLQASVYAAAGALVPEQFLGGSFIELLRNKTLLTRLGVGTLSGLVGNVAIPRQSTAATAYWLAEGDSVTESDQSFAQVGATPKRLAAQTAFTKQLLAQAGLDAEALIRDDLTRILAIAKDLAGIAGTGGKQPLGILNGPTTASDGNKLGTVTFGAAATWANVLGFENAIETANADIGTMQWLTNPTVKNKWKSTVKVANYPVFICDDRNEAAGYPVNVTNQITTSGTYANRAIFAAWNQAMFCEWAGMDVVVDPYTQAAANKIVLTLNLFCDFIVRHWPSFAISTDSAAQ